MESYFLGSLMTLVINCEINVKTSFKLQMLPTVWNMEMVINGE